MFWRLRKVTHLLPSVATNLDFWNLALCGARSLVGVVRANFVDGYEVGDEEGGLGNGRRMEVCLSHSGSRCFWKIFQNIGQ